MLKLHCVLFNHDSDLSEKQKAGISAALDDISADRDDSLRTVRGYVILEMLGKGAYGAVYKARRARGDMLVALKELPLTDIGIFGVTDAERNEGVGRMNKEVEILSSLSHPNIVQVGSWDHDYHIEPPFESRQLEITNHTRQYSLSAVL